MQINPYLKVVVAALIMGSSGVFVKNLRMDAEVLSFFRMAVPTFFLGGWFLIKRQSVWHGNLVTMGLASLLNALRLWLFMVGYLFTTIANGVLVLYSWPVFTALFSVFFLGEKVTFQRFIWMMIPLAGLGFMMSDKPFSFGNDDFIGMAAMLASAIIYAYTMILYKRESANYSKFEIVFFQNAAGGILFIPAGILGWGNLDFMQITGAIIFGVLLGIIAFGLFFSALRHIKASTASYLSYLEVVVTIILGILLYGDPFTLPMAIGGTMILVSTYFLRK